MASSDCKFARPILNEHWKLKCFIFGYVFLHPFVHFKNYFNELESELKPHCMKQMAEYFEPHYWSMEEGTKRWALLRTQSECFLWKEGSLPRLGKACTSKTLSVEDVESTAFRNLGAAFIEESAAELGTVTGIPGLGLFREQSILSRLKRRPQGSCSYLLALGTFWSRLPIHLGWARQGCCRQGVHQVPASSSTSLNNSPIPQSSIFFLAFQFVLCKAPSLQL